MFLANTFNAREIKENITKQIAWRARVWQTLDVYILLTILALQVVVILNGFLTVATCAFCFSSRIGTRHFQRLKHVKMLFIIQTMCCAVSL